MSHATCCNVPGCTNGYVFVDCQFGFGLLATWVLRRFLLCDGLLQAGRLLPGPMLPSDALLPLGLLQAHLLCADELLQARFVLPSRALLPLGFLQARLR